MCQSSGPGQDMFESTRIIGENIFKKAKVSAVSTGHQGLAANQAGQILIHNKYLKIKKNVIMTLFK